MNIKMKFQKARLKLIQMNMFSMKGSKKIMVKWDKLKNSIKEWKNNIKEWKNIIKEWKNKCIHSLWAIKYLLTLNRCNLKLIMNNKSKKKVLSFQKKDYLLLSNNKIKISLKSNIKYLLKKCKSNKTLCRNGNNKKPNINILMNIITYNIDRSNIMGMQNNNANNTKTNSTMWQNIVKVIQHITKIINLLNQIKITKIKINTKIINIKSVPIINTINTKNMQIINILKIINISILNISKIININIQATKISIIRTLTLFNNPNN